MTLFYSTFLTGFFSSSKSIYHFHFQKLITDSPDSLAFVSLEKFVKFIDPFLSKREREGSPFHPRQKVSSFLVLRREEGERGERRKFEGRGRGKTRVQPRPTFFQRGARERRERLLLESPFHLALLSPTPARIRSWKFGSSRDSTTRP